MLRAILFKSWRQYPTKQQLCSHQPHITKTIKIGRTRHAGHCWRIRDELIRDALLWTPSHGRAKAGRPGRTHIQQLSCPENLPEVMDDREGWLEWVRDICADGMTYIYIHIYIYIYIYIYICVCVCVCVCLCG